MRKKKKDRLSPLQQSCLNLSKNGPVTLSMIQRNLQVSFVKACELAYTLTEKGLIESNIDDLKIWN